MTRMIISTKKTHNKDMPFFSLFKIFEGKKIKTERKVAVFYTGVCYSLLFGISPMSHHINE